MLVVEVTIETSPLVDPAIVEFPFPPPPPSLTISYLLAVIVGLAEIEEACTRRALTLLFPFFAILVVLLEANVLSQTVFLFCRRLVCLIGKSRLNYFCLSCCSKTSEAKYAGIKL